MSALTDLSEAEKWIGMIGKKQPHTTSDASGYVANLSVSADIHYQERDGSKNYWEIPTEFKKCLSEYIKANMSVIAPAALEYMRKSKEEDLNKELKRVQVLMASLEAEKEKIKKEN